MNRKGYVYFNDLLCGQIEETDEGFVFKYTSEWLENEKDNQFL